MNPDFFIGFGAGGVCFFLLTLLLAAKRRAPRQHDVLTRDKFLQNWRTNNYEQK